MTMDHDCKEFEDTCGTCIGEMLADNAKLRADLELAKKFHTDEYKNRLELTAKVESLELQVGELRKWVEEYGGHYSGCAAHSNQRGTSCEGHCDCGWAEIKAKYIEKQVPEKKNEPALKAQYECPLCGVTYTGQRTCH